ncbi:MAG TPA: hypothetical protein VMV77_03440 [Bacteroidales bacterium]|nr:hypothetical protein [Bacteroidales bacterium]
MKHFGMIEFQFVEGSKAPTISDQFNSWSDDNEDVTVLQINSHVIQNHEGLVVETMFVLFSFK